MQILAICLRKPALRMAAFSLLELMVVLVLLGSITALALPNLTRLYESVSLKTDRDFILDQFQGLGSLARVSKNNFILPADSDTEGGASRHAEYFTVFEPDLPQGWSVEVDRDLIVRANGICLGTELTLLYSGEEYARMELAAPYCKIAR